MSWFRRTGFLTLAFVMSLTACAPATTPAPAAEATQPPAAEATTAPTSDGVFDVIKADGTTVAFTLDDLKALPLTSIVSDGNPQEGPSLLAVLEKAGVTDFSEITLTGADGSKTLTRAEVTDQVILNFNNRGSVKLVAPDLAKDARIRDIVTIEVK